MQSGFFWCGGLRGFAGKKFVFPKREAKGKDVVLVAFAFPSFVGERAEHGCVGSKGFGDALGYLGAKGFDVGGQRNGARSGYVAVQSEFGAVNGGGVDSAELGAVDVFGDVAAGLGDAFWADGGGDGWVHAEQLVFDRADGKANVVFVFAAGIVGSVRGHDKEGIGIGLHVFSAGCGKDLSKCACWVGAMGAPPVGKGSVGGCRGWEDAVAMGQSKGKGADAKFRAKGASPAVRSERAIGRNGVAALAADEFCAEHVALFSLSARSGQPCAGGSAGLKWSRGGKKWRIKKKKSRCRKS